MRYKDLDSQHRFQRAWDAMMEQKADKPQKEEVVKEPRIVRGSFDWTAFCIGFFAAMCCLLLVGAVAAIVHGC